MPVGPDINMFKFHTYCNRSLAWLEIKSTKHFWILFASPEWGLLSSIEGPLKKDNIVKKDFNTVTNKSQKWP